MIHNIKACILLVGFAQSRERGSAPEHGGYTQGSMDAVFDGVFDKLVSRGFGKRSFREAVFLDPTALAKFGPGAGSANPNPSNRFSLQLPALRSDIVRRAKWLNAKAKQLPRTTAFCSGFALSTLGDITAQCLEREEGHRRGADATGHGLDLQRALAMGTFSACFVTAFIEPWFGFLARKLGEGSLRSAVTTAAADNLLAIPFVSVPTLYAFTSVLRGQDLETARRRFQETYFETLKSSWMLWMPGDVIIFGVIPAHLRVPVACAFDYAWAAAVSLASNRQSSSSPAAVEAARV